jgi:hypothetical protein
VVKAPARDPSDFGIAHSAEPVLFLPEKAKRTSTPKRFLHMGSFALFEVGFIGRVVGVRVTFDFDVSLDGCATGVAQPNLAWLPLVIPRFTEEGTSHDHDAAQNTSVCASTCSCSDVFVVPHRHRLEKIS